MASYGDATKQGDTLEYWLKDSFAKIEFSEQQIKDMAQIMNPLRDQVEEAMSLFDDKRDRWSNFRIAIWKAIPDAYVSRLERTIEKWLREGEITDPSGRKSYV